MLNIFNHNSFYWKVIEKNHKYVYEFLICNVYIVRVNTIQYDVGHTVNNSKKSKTHKIKTREATRSQSLSGNVA